jgi:hypothetical protein
MSTQLKYETHEVAVSLRLTIIKSDGTRRAYQLDSDGYWKLLIAMNKAHTINPDFEPDDVFASNDWM